MVPYLLIDMFTNAAVLLNMVSYVSDSVATFLLQLTQQT